MTIHNAIEALSICEKCGSYYALKPIIKKGDLFAFPAPKVKGYCEECKKKRDLML